MAFEDMTVGKFLDDLASDLPAPGGGSVAALCGALASGLVSMVGSLTVGKEKYRDSWEPMERVLCESEALRAEFVALMSEDIASFNGFMAALRMPRTTEEEKSARKAAMSDAAKAAAEVPLRCLEACVRTASLASEAADFGNPTAASDAGCAALLAEAAGKSAAFNVKVNFPSIRDEAFVEECRGRMERALEELRKLAAEVDRKMEGVVG